MAARRLFAPIRDDDPSFPGRPVVVLLVGIGLILTTVIAVSFLVAWRARGEAYWPVGREPRMLRPRITTVPSRKELDVRRV